MLRSNKKPVPAADAAALDDNKKTRSLPRGLDLFVTAALTLLGFYHIYVGFFGAKSAMELRSVHWLVISVVIFLIYPAAKGSVRRVTAFDWLWLALAVASGLYILLNWERIALNAGVVNTTDILFGVVAIAVVLESARRSIGPVLAGMGGVFLAYGLLGHLIPGVLGHRAYSVNRIVTFLYTGTEGIYGTAMDVSAKYVALFVLFGALLEAFGGGQLFVDIAYSLTGRMRGGPAKAAVVSSALMGTMSGSAVANVVTTGAFTIPLMKKNGYRAHVAAAVEAVASTGGQIMPPVMGAAAFLMAEMTGISYSEIMIAALIPAFFYFFAIFMMVDLEAAKESIPVPEDDQIKPLGQILRTGGYLIAPLALLVFMIFRGYSAILAAAYAIALILVTDLIFSRDRRNMPKKLLAAVGKGMKSVVSVASACACSGIVVGIISLTGIGAKFSSLMLSVAGSSIFIALLMTMVASLILGCGLPTTAAYMVLATLAVPALVKMEVPLLAAHLFVLYFGSISTITPPVALSAYAGAALAGANPNTVGFTAFRFGIVAFIVPFMFVYQPSLLMQGSVPAILQTLVTGTLGVIMIAVGVQGYWKAPCLWWERGLGFAAGLLMIDTNLITDILGIACTAAVVISQMRRRQTVAPPAA